MHGWWIFMGCLTAAGSALASVHYRQRRARRVRIARVRATVEAWLSAPNPPVGEVPTLSSPTGPQQPDDSLIPPTRGVVRCRRRVVLGDTSSLSITLGPGWRLR